MASKTHLLIPVVVVLLGIAVVFVVNKVQDRSSDTPPADSITLTHPAPQVVIKSPVAVTGQARGTWFFEASFPVRIIDSSGLTLGSAPAQVQGEWMTNEFVPFEAVVTYTEPAVTTTGFIVLQKDNPSGLPQYNDERRIPVVIAAKTVTDAALPSLGHASSAVTTTVRIFLGNQQLLTEDQDVCLTVFPVIRVVSTTPAIGQIAMHELLKGPTAAEEAEGYTTSLPEGVRLQAITIANGTAAVDFSSGLNRVAGSCRVRLIREQIISTLEQFPTVEDAVISVNGKIKDILQP